MDLDPVGAGGDRVGGLVQEHRAEEHERAEQGEADGLGRGQVGEVPVEPAQNVATSSTAIQIQDESTLTGTP